MAIEASARELPGIVVMTHGPLAEALVASSSMLFGSMRNVFALPLSEGEDPDGYLGRLRAAMEGQTVPPIFLIDVLGGTPFNTLMRYARDHEVYAISGVNMPMLLEAGHARKKLDGASLLAAVAAAGREGMVDLSPMIEEAKA